MQTSPRRPFQQSVSFILCVTLLLSSWVVVSFPTTASAAPATVTKVLQEGVDGYTGMSSATVSSLKPDTPSPGISVLTRRDYGDYGDSRPFFKIDLPSIPQNATITDAKFELSALPFGNSGNGTVSVDVYRVAQDWNESSITWNTSITNPIYDSIPYSTKPIGCAGNSAICSFDLTGLVQQWVEGTSENYGFMLKVADEIPSVNWSRGFHPETFYVVSLRPKLTITYTVAATGVDVTPSTLSLIRGGSTEQLIATVLPDTAMNKNVTWSSSDPAIATVDASGVVTPVGRGTATITVTTEDGSFTDTSTVTVSEPTDLSQLTLSKGTLSPAFEAGTTHYTAAVTNDVYSLTVTPITVDAHATMTVNGHLVKSGTPSEAIQLNVGDNEITVTVTAQDGTTNTYMVKVTRAASNSADLTNVELSKGTLTPAFASGTTAYAAAVTNDVYKLTITATTLDANSTVTVNGQPVKSGTPSEAIELNVGDNKIVVTVTAQDGITTKTYTIVVTRLNASSPAPDNGGHSGSYNGGSSSGPPVSPVNPSEDKTDEPKDTETPSEGSNGAACPQLTWTDTRSHWARPYIDTASQLCIIKGVSSDKLLPDEEVTRLQFALMVARAMKLQPVDHTGVLEAYQDREDIPAWASEELSAAIQAGIIEGYNDDMLRPNKKISRAELITMLIRGQGLSAANAATSFKDDAEIPAWAKGYVRYAEQLGVIEGRSNNRFEPSSTATRAEAVVILVRMLQDKQ
ncbi:hypothetical protein BBD41_10780 [Paenibacillus ihbetae]|uniref:SLH domain-containing protein n=1 Tax=Paenibacillus ihbetae TaxID=1870820 RepID=A0A1B2DZA6_9BACL|nr:cadherin-like beta sandwich domain-containing protein [Paenibacillus ihbetae]ANY73033.1 hypothetical protein BBD41_10780 [Paenibacillus ihbetae]